MTLLSTLLLSLSLFAMDVNTPADSHNEKVIEISIESVSESESSTPQVVWDDLYTHLQIEFASLQLEKVSSDSHFVFFEVCKDIFRPPWHS